MPRTIRTTGDRGLDRELDLLWEQIKQITVVEAPQSTVVTPPFEIGPYVRTIAEQPNAGASGDITFTDSGGTEITQAGQNFDFYSPPLCDDPPKDVNYPTVVEVGTDNFTGTNGDVIDYGGAHPYLDDDTTEWRGLSFVTGYSNTYITSNSVTDGGFLTSAGAFALVDDASPTVSVWADLRYTTATNREAAYLLARGFGNRTGTTTVRWYQAGYNGALGQWEISGSNFGSGLGTLASLVEAINPDQTYALEFRISDYAKSLYVDGVLKCTTTNNVLTATSAAYNRCGFLVIGSPWHATNKAYFDNYRQTSIQIPYAGVSTYASRCDHVHEGVHSVARRTASGTAGTAFTGDVVLQEDGGIDLGEDVANNRIKIASGYRRRLMLMGA